MPRTVHVRPTGIVTPAGPAVLHPIHALKRLVGSPRSGGAVELNRLGLDAMGTLWAAGRHGDDVYFGGCTAIPIQARSRADGTRVVSDEAMLFASDP